MKRECCSCEDIVKMCPSGIWMLYNDNMTKVLIIEDEMELVKVLRLYLEKASFTVSYATNGNEGLEKWGAEKPDLVLLDLNLPGMDGLDITRQMRKISDTPILMITARVDEMDRLIGLELGADDYISKPFSPREVVARVKAVLRRTNGSQQKEANLLTIGELTIDLDAHQASRSGSLLDLTPTEFSLLAVLASHPGRVFSRLQLLEQSQGTAYEGYERTIDAHIKNLRAKVETDPHNPKCIETVFGIGYRFHRS
jgi:two-component system, OmpR family, alkaline phosphatase synthesis response regulator PhoP